MHPLSFSVFYMYIKNGHSLLCSCSDMIKYCSSVIFVLQEPIRAYLPERICYDRDFLLSLRDCGVRPILAEEFSSIVNQSISNEARSYEASLIERRPIQGRSR